MQKNRLGNFPTRFIIEPFFPTRFCLKMTGPFESILIAKHKIKRIGDNTMIPAKDNKKSIPLFKPSLYTLFPLFIRSICKSDDIFSQLFIVLWQALDKIHHFLY